MFAITRTSIQGFSRLKGLFRHGLNYQTYGKIILSTKRPIIGNIPDDLLKLILRSNPNNKKTAILATQEAFFDTSYILSNIEKINTQAINRSRKSIDSLIDAIKEGNLALFYKDKIYIEKSAQLLNEAEQVMLNKLKGVLPNVKNIKLSSLGNGAYSNVFKCEIFDDNGVKLISDKVIKSYKSSANADFKLYEKISSCFSQYSDDDILRYAQEKGIKLDLSKIKDFRQKIIETLEGIKANTSGKAYMETMHGASAEANVTEYIRYMSGHKIKESEGLVLPDLFVLSDRPFSVSRFVEGNVSAKRFNFKRLGLEHSDLVNNPGNLINNTCIDLGGINILPSCKDVVKLAKELKDNKALSEIDKMLIINQMTRKSKIIGNRRNTQILKQIQDAPTEKQEMLYDALRIKYKDEKTVSAALEEVKNKKLYHITPKNIIEEECLNTDFEKMVSFDIFS